jgi:hypothetical protein
MNTRGGIRVKKWKGQRLLSIVVALLMIFSLLPSGVLPVRPAHAASTFFNFQSISNTFTNTVQVNQSTWTVTAGFDSSIIGNTISYTVQPAYLSTDGMSVNIVQGQMNKGNGPNIDSNNLIASFANVPLFSGLNAVTFYGQRNDGSSVQNTGYIYNASVPVISSISIGGQQLTGNSPTIVTNPNFSFTVVAPNATTLQVYQSGNPVPYSGMPTLTNTFSVSNFNFNDANGNPVGGEYTFTFVASDATHQYSVTRNVIFYPSPMPTFYGMQATFGSQGPFSIDYKPTISVDATSNPLSTIAGHLVLDDKQYLPSGSNSNTVDVKVYDSTGTNLITSTTVSLAGITPVDNGTYSDFSFSTSNLNQSLGNGTYQVKLFLNGSTLVQTDTFTIRNPNGIYFNSVSELTNVTGQIAGDNTATSSNGVPITLPGNNLSVAQVPNYLEASMTNASSVNISKSAGYFHITAKQNGTTTSLTQGTDFDLYTLQDGNVGIKFYDLPAGNYVLTITYNDGTNNDSISLNVTNQIAPNIQLFNIYDTEVFTTVPSGGLTVNGQLVNFPSPSGTQVNISLNGTAISPVQADQYGKFTLNVPTLQSGQNILVITAYVNNSPVQLRYTLNYASNTKPIISVSNFKAWDQNNNPVSITQSGSNINAYATNGTTASFTVSYSNASNISVSVSGNSTPIYQNSMTQTTTTVSVPLSPQVLVAGTTTFTITASDTSGNIVTLTVLITRNQTPFSVVFPTDFQANQTYVTNSNFIDLVIMTSTADDVNIGKIEATPFNTNTVYGTTEYGVEIQNLKPGLNTIPVLITRGTNKIKGSVTVNYLNQNRIGAEYKGLLPSSGTITGLNGIVQLQFAKNTVFQPQNPNPGQPPVSQQYYSNQQVLFGIADRNTGNVSKVSMQLNTPVFPSLSYSATDSRIPLDIDENYASNVIWVDAGDPTYQSQQSGTSSSFLPEGGLDPAGVMSPVDILSGNVAAYQNNNYLSRIGASGQVSYSHWLEPTTAGNITLQYDPTIRNAATTSLTILYLDHQTGKWTKIGGVVNTSKHTITAPFKGFGYYVVASFGNRYLDIAQLTDVNGMWAKPYVETMLAKGIMEPESTTSFGVYDPITRGEFAEILVKALGIPLNYDSNKLTFSDVGIYKAPGQMWDYQYIETAARAGIVTGIGGGLFNPNAPITRQDATLIIAHAANLPMAIDPSASLVALKKAFTDAGSINPYAAPSVLAVYQKGIMAGIPNPLTGAKAKQTYSFNPQGNLLRAEAAVIATRLMQQLKLLPTKL